MSADQYPKSFGVFKPTGHVLTSLPTDETAKRAAEAFLQAGFKPSDVT